MRCLALVLFVLVSKLAVAQNIESYGIYGGFNIPFTSDQGLARDPRFVTKFLIRATPIGINYGYDHVDFGYNISPCFVRIGQQFTIKNTAGGDVGSRDVSMSYLSVPMSLKIHINDMAFFRFSLVAGLNAAFLIHGEETITHTASKLYYPAEVAIPDDPNYIKVYDGVFVPDVNKQVYVSSDKFRVFQLFGSIGANAEFDFNDDWGLFFDGRANFGLFDPRKSSYTDLLKTGTNVPDVYGSRREIFLSGTIGISRIIQIKPNFKSKVSAPVPKMKMAHQKFDNKIKVKQTMRKKKK